MTKRASRLVVCAVVLSVFVATPHGQGRGGRGGQAPPPESLTPRADASVQRLKDLASEDIKSQAMYDLGQQMIDMVFSFGELGFQEFETQKYLGKVMRDNGFTVTDGVADIPTAWVAKWGAGHPIIAFGSDVDCIPQGSQKPGVAYHDPIVAGAPGHGEGHNGGTPLNIVAAIAVKRIMEREKIPGTLMIWPGIAEELLGTKAYFVRAGLFKDVDIVLYNHVGAGMSTSWGDGGGSGLISVEYLFAGETAHGASAPWRGRSALDAAELMNKGWNYRREHLRLAQRSHYTITNGGDQPNVVPRNAGVWYYFRETEYDGVKNMWDIGDKMAAGAALMTNTTWTSRVLGSAWPRHTNRTVAEAMQHNIESVGLPAWTDADVAVAKGIQRELKEPEIGLPTRLGQLRGREQIPDEEKLGGPSDDIGDVSWNVPTASLSFPANIQAGPGHNWANAISMATPIAHKGVNAAARVQAMTAIDLLMRPELIKSAKAYFENVQLKQRKYTPLIRPTDKPAIWMNKEVMDRYRPEMRKYYFDPTKYKTYLDQMKAQFGTTYPTVRK